MLLTSRYRVIQTLGSGGFGETFLAEDTQMPSRRRCVVKLLKPITSNPQIYQLVQERFEREAAILEELGGKNEQIPSLYAYFEADGQFYLVQEWIQGVTLSKVVRDRGLLDEDQVRGILSQILPILEFVHQQRIIHRDIKPDNIILRQHDGKPVLIDFGAVRESMGTSLNSQGNTTSSIVIGTPGYMPSEQAMGRPMYASDLYSLGMTAVYLLTGKIPQGLETDQETGEIIWRQFAPNLSPGFADILDKSIAYHPRERFTSAQAMLEALRAQIPTVEPTNLNYQQLNSLENQPTSVPSFVQALATDSTQKSTNNKDTKYQQTIAVGNSQPIQSSSSSPANLRKSNRVLKTGLIAGGLIAASLIMGITLTRQNTSSTSTILSANPNKSNTDKANSPDVSKSNPQSESTTNQQGTVDRSNVDRKLDVNSEVNKKISADGKSESNTKSNPNQQPITSSEPLNTSQANTSQAIIANQPENNQPPGSTTQTNPTQITNPQKQSQQESQNQANQSQNSQNQTNQNQTNQTNNQTGTQASTDFSWLSQRRVTADDLSGKDAYTLDIMRNSIYARRGFRFSTPGLQNYFDQQSWYQPIYPPASQTKNTQKILSSLEIENAMAIRDYQQKNNLLFFR